ncbi:MAG: NUDIX domain-containing protein [Patescibacteria group bacterium]
MPHYAQVKVVVGTVLRKNDKYLLLKDKKIIAKRKWTVPAGRAEINHTIVQNAIRETYEESGFRVKLVKKLFIYHEDLFHPVRHVFLGEIIGGHLSFPKREILDAEWFTFKEIQKMYRENKIRHHWVWQAIVTVEKSKKG